LLHIIIFIKKKSIVTIKGFKSSNLIAGLDFKMCIYKKKVIVDKSNPEFGGKIDNYAET